MVIDSPVMSLDLTATALDVGGVDSSKGRLDGINLLPVLTDKPSQSPDRTLFWRVGNKNALRSGDWKLVRDGNDWQLYNLANDSGETSDLASQEMARVQQMSNVWDQWNAQQIESLWK
jgi:arylsulfatase A-like enzyme